MRKFLSTLQRKRVLTSVVHELLALLAVVAGTIVQLAHIANSGWRQIFLYNSDSLTLPLLWKSLENHEKITWVFSSQLNLFPEAVVYGAIRFFTDSVRASLTINAIVNVLLFYVLVRLILSVCTTSGVPATKKLPAQTYLSPNVQRAYGLVAVFVLLGGMLLETYTRSSSQDMATYFLFNTYYYGIALCGLLVLYLTLRLTRAPIVALRLFVRSPLHMALALSIILTTGLVIASNPLYIVQIALPLILALGALYGWRMLTRGQVAVLIGLQLIGILIGFVLRHFLVAFIGEDVSNRIQNILSIESWKLSLSYLVSMAAPVDTPLLTRLRILLSIVIYYCCLMFVLLFLRKQQNTRTKHDSTISPQLLLGIVFVAVQPLVTALLLVSVRSIKSRYFVTSIVITVLGLVLILATIKNQRARQYISRGTVLAACIFICVSIFYIPSKIQPLASTHYPEMECLAAALDYQPANGIGDYWVARPLDVYNTYDQRILQTVGLTPYAWLNNLDTYRDKDFTFVVKEHKPTGIFSILMSQDAYKKLGQPSKSTVCSTFIVLQYDKNTPGHTMLNTKLRSAVEAQLKARAAGKITEFNYKD